MKRYELAAWIVSVIAVVGLMFYSTRDSGDAISLPAMPALDALDRVATKEIQDRYQAITNGKTNELSLLALQFLVYGYFGEAEQCCATAIELVPDSFELHYLRGVSLDRMGRMDEAIAAFAAASELAASPQGRLECAYNIAMNRLRLEQPEAAIVALDECDGFPSASLIRSRLLLEQGHAQESLPILKGLLSTYPIDHQVHQLIARANESIGRQESADRHWAFAQRGNAAIQTDLITGMLTEQGKHLGLRAQYTRGDQLIDARRYAEAEPVIASALQVQWNFKAAMRLSAAKIQLGKVDEAIELMQKIIDREGGFSDVYALLGMGYELKGDTVRAAKLSLQATLLGPSPGAHEFLASYYEVRDPERQQFHMAEFHYEKAEKAFRNSDLPGAVESLRSAVKFNEDHRDAWILLGDSLHGLGKTDEAEASHERAATL